MSKLRSTFKEYLIDYIILMIVFILIAWSVRHSVTPLCTKQNSILLYRDIFPVLDKRLELCRYLSTWYCGADLEQNEMTSALWYQILFLPLLYMLPTYGCYQIVTRLLILFSAFITSYISGVVLLNDLLTQGLKTRKVILRIVISIISLTYVFNPFLYSITADRLFMFSYSVLPLYFTLLYKALRCIGTTSCYNSKNVLKFSLLLAVLYSLILSKINVAVYVAIVTFVCIIYVLIVSALRKIPKLINVLKSTMLLFLLFIAFVSILNLHFVANSAYLLHVGVRPPVYDVNINVIRLLAAKKNMFNSLTFQGGFWPVMNYSLPPIVAIIPSLLIVLLYVIALKFMDSIDRLLTTLYLLIIVMSFGFIALSYYIPEAYYKIFIQTMPKTVGWTFRAPERIHVIQLPLMIITFYITIKWLFKNCNVNYHKKAVVVLLVTLLIVFTLFSYIKIEDGYFGGVYRPVYYPDAWVHIKRFLEHNVTVDRYNIIVLPYSFNGYQWYSRPCWNIYPVSIDAEIFYIKAKEQGLPYILSLFDKNVVNEKKTCFTQLSMKYVVITKDVRSSNENVSLIPNSLENIGIIKKVFEESRYYEVYELKWYNIRHKIYTTSAIVFSDRFRCLPLPLVETPLYYSIRVPSNAIILYSVDDDDFLDVNKNYREILIEPALFTHYNGVDAEYRWVRGYTSDPIHAPWHLYIENLNIENWQTDYGYGLVFTWARFNVPFNLRLSNEDLIKNWTFDNHNDCFLWRENTPSKQFNAIQQMICRNGVLEVKPYNSTWGWKAIKSPLIPVNPEHAYRFVIRVRGINAHKVHIKIAEFDSNRKLIDVRYVRGVGDGTFYWKEVVFDYVPSSRRVRYVQLQIWYGHLTNKPLPNIMMIDYVRVYDVTKYAKRVTLDMPFEVLREGEYRLFVRLFENQKGGSIRIYLDGKLVAEVNTSSQLNRFVWRDLGVYRLEPGRHVLTLENVEGFNAVNVFVLIPVDEYERIVKEFEELLENKTVIYLFEAESDMFRSGAEIVKNINASNGEELLFNVGGSAWQSFEVVKDGYYMLAIRLNGSAVVELDDMVFNVSSDGLGFVYVGPVYLSKGVHKVVVKPAVHKVASLMFTNESVVELWKRPRNESVAYLQLQIWHDHLTDKPLPNIVWVKDVEVYRYVPTYLDAVWIYSVNSPSSRPTVEDLFKVKEEPAKVIDYKRIDPTLWRAEIVAKKPFMLVFAKAYDPLWEARVYKDGRLVERVRSDPVYGVINGFWINETGNLTIAIRYVPQDWFELGLKISATTFALCVFYLVWDWRRGRGDRWALRLERQAKSIPRYLERSISMRVAHGSS